MSKFIGFIIGGIEVIAGVVLVATGIGGPLGVELIIQGSVMIAAQGVADLTAPKAPARQASEMTISLGEQPRSMFLGQGFTAGTLVDAFDFGGKYGTDWEVMIIRLADEPCEGLVQFKVNDTFYDYTGDGFYTQFDTHHFQLYFRADTSVDPLPSIVLDNGPGWTADDIGRSGCDVIVAYLADSPTAKNPAWPGGRPTFGFVLKGGKRYDPRLDDTAGGSGAQRRDDPSTWLWSENPAVCRYNWVRGIYADGAVDDPTQLLVGRGLSAAEAPPANVFAPANLCDEAVAGGVRYRVAGPIYANQAFIDVEQMFTLATGGSTITREGSVELEPGQSKSVVASFTDADLLVGSKAGWNEAVLSDADSGWVNSVVANYVEPAQQWSDHDAPVARNTDDIVADGGPKEATLSLRLVKDVGQAQRIAEISRRLGRLWGRASVTLGPRFCQIEEGDWIEWQSDRRFAGATRTFRVEAYQIDEKSQNTLTLREIAADVFDGAFTPPSDLSVTTPTAPPPDVGAPGGAQWTLSAVTLTTGGIAVPALEITGSASDDTTAGGIVFEYWKSDGVIDPLTNPDDPPWTMEGTHSRDTTKVDITAIDGGAAYYAAVTYVVSGIPGDRLVLGPVTSGSMDVSGQVNPLIDAKLGNLSWKEPVRAKTTAALAANTYANGASGVGATLTATANGALAAQDGVTLVAGERLLVDHEATGSHNGIYALTQVGDATHPYILTRTTDADEAAELVNAAAKVSEGTAAADQEWQCTTNAPIIVGTTALVWAQASGGGGTAANPTATASDTAVNGTATTFMRSDAAPAVQKGSSAQFGIVKPDGTSITSSGGVLSATGASAPGTPGTIPDLVIWVETDNILANSGSAIAVLVNRTPWDNWPFGSTGNSGAAIDAALLNGLPVLNFVASSDGHYNAVSSIGAKLTKATVFVLFKPNAIGANQAFLAGATGALNFRIETTGKLGLVRDNVANIGQSTPAVTAGTWVQANATYDAASGAFAFRVAKAAAGSGTNVQAITTQSFVLGYDNASLGADLNSKLAALIAYNRVLSPTEIASVEAYLTTKWGV